MEHEQALYALSRDPTLLRALVSPGHTLGTPEPIFREIKAEEVEAWRQKFRGKSTM